MIKRKIEKDILICIDPGHQEKGDSNSEPVAPGSYVKKARVSSGATGVATKKARIYIKFRGIYSFKTYIRR